jgi:hypothetical protein
LRGRVDTLFSTLTLLWMTAASVQEASSKLFFVVEGAKLKTGVGAKVKTGVEANIAVET